MTQPLRAAARILPPVLLVLLALPALADLSELSLEPAATGLNEPVAITHAGDARLFITLRDGRILVLEGGQVRPQPFLDIRALVRSAGGEQGLLSAAFHPAYAGNGRFFVNYTNQAGDTVIARYQVSGDPNVANPASAAILLTIPQTFSNHNGGQLQFGPDGFLYVGMGDGGSANDPQCDAQDGSSLLGKMLRLDVDQGAGAPPFHTVPASNPFVGDGSVRDEVWAQGLRNPWRFSFDRLTGDLLIADVGQNAREEVSFQAASSAGGENYGWKVMEGNLCLGSTSGCSGPVPGCNSPQYTAPILEYSHGGGRCSITGGYVYRGSRIAALQGFYLYGDFCAGTLWAAERVGGTWQSQQLAITASLLTSFGEDFEGELYLAAGSTIFRLVGADLPMPGTLAFDSSSLSVREDAGMVEVRVRRIGGADGTVTVDFGLEAGSAGEGDYQVTASTLVWPDGDASDRSVFVAIVDDDQVEGDETLTARLASPTGGATLGEPSSTTITILDDDVVTEPCVASASTLCLNGERFRVEIAWQTQDGTAGSGQAVLLSPDSGYFWFFDPDNPEIFVKVLDACVDPFNHFWVFAAGLTDVETSLTVVDTATGELRRYDKPLGAGFDPIRDTTAFPTCP